MLKTILVSLLVSLASSVLLLASTRTAPAQTPGEADYKAGLEYRTDGKFQPAAQAFERAVAAAPRNGIYRFALADVMRAMREGPKAWYQMRQALIYAPEYRAARQGFEQMWRYFDDKGVVNVGVGKLEVKKRLGTPDRTKLIDGGELWVYGHRGVRFRESEIDAVVMDARRPSPAPARDRVEVRFDERQWKLKFRLLDEHQTLESWFSGIETPQRWRESVHVQRMIGADDVAAALARIERMLKKRAPTATFTVLERNTDHAVYHWSVPVPPGTKDAAPGEIGRAEVARLIRGRGELHRVSFARKAAIGASDRDRWKDRLLAAKLVPLEKR